MADEPTDFQTKMLLGIGGLQQGQTDILAGMTKMDASITTLYRMHGENKDALAIHARDCELRDAVAKIDQKLSAGDYPGSKAVWTELQKFRNGEQKRIGANQVTDKWLSWIRPVVPWVVVALIVLLALNWRAIVKAIGFPFGG